jgi:hypothetical protein
MLLGSNRNSPETRVTTDKPKNLLLDAARIVGRGFLLGVGFSIALGAAVLIAQQVIA